MQSLSHCTADNGIFLSSIWRSWPHLSSSGKKKKKNNDARESARESVWPVLSTSYVTQGCRERGREGADLDVAMGDLLGVCLTLSFLRVSQEAPEFGV